MILYYNIKFYKERSPKNFVFLFFAVFNLFLFRSEAVAEIFDALGVDTEMTSCTEWSPTLFYVFKPHCKEWLITAGRKTFYSYNSMGLRDRDYSKFPRKNFSRVLFIGASRVAAAGVEEESSIPKILEKKLKKIIPNIEIINASVPGYRPIHFSIFIKKLIGVYHPTHVIYLTAFPESGAIMQNFVFNLELVRDADGNPLQLGKNIGGVKYWLHNNFHFIIWEIMTFVYTSYWAYKSTSCKFFSGNEKKMARCFLSLNMEMIYFVQKTVEESGAKFSLIYTEEDFVNNLKIPPHWSKKVAQFMDYFVPKVLVKNEVIENLIAESGITALKIEAGDLKMLKDNTHYNKKSLNQMATRIINAFSYKWFTLAR